MSDRAIRSREILLRTARIKEAKASFELARSWKAEREAIKEADDTAALCSAATQARGRHAQEHGDLAINEYFTLSQLCESLYERLEDAAAVLSDRKQARIQSAKQAEETKRMATKVEEECQRQRRAVAVYHEGRRSLEAIELWLEARERS